MQCVLAYDLGTGGVKASLFNKNAENISHAFVEYKTYYSAGGYHEQNPNDWYNAIRIATKKLINNSNTLPTDIMAIGLSGHSLGIVPIDCNGELLVEKTPIWSDTRASLQAEKFFEAVDYKTWYNKTGNGFPAHLYSIFKIAWCKENQKDIYDKTYKFLGTKDYINFLLTNVTNTDYSYASGSGVYDLLEKKYCDEYIKAIDIEKNKFPSIVDSNKIIGTLQKKPAQELGLIEGIPVVCGGVDNACMSLGAGCFEQGDTYASLGSSAWVTVATKEPILDFDKKPYVWAHCVNDMYIPSAGVFSSGSSMKWVKDNLFCELNQFENPYKKMDELATQSSVGANKLVFCAQLAGGSSIDISPNVRGGFFGLDLSHNKSDIARAVLEGIVYNLKSAYDVLNDRAKLSSQLLLVGGGAQSSIFRQIYSDVFGIDMVKTDIMQDAASLGAAALAAVGCGFWDDYSIIRKAHNNISITKPIKENNEKYKELYQVYLKVCEAQAIISTII